MRDALFDYTSNSELKTALVIMPFRDEYWHLYQQAKHFLESEGWRGYRLDEIPPTGDMQTTLEYEMKRTDAVLALCPDKNQHVFFEIGIAFALKKRLLVIHDENIIFSDFFCGIQRRSVSLRNSDSVGPAIREFFTRSPGNVSGVTS